MDVISLNNHLATNPILLTWKWSSMFRPRQSHMLRGIYILEGSAEGVIEVGYEIVRVFKAD
jgi:hypothetical protein